MIIPFYKNYFSQKDIEYTNRVIKRGMYWANGPEIEQFEKKIARLAGKKYCAVFNSGTSALFAILSAIGIEGKEVIVPSFTFISTSNSVLYAGGKPVFADIEDKTFGLDYIDVKKKITHKTKAIIIVHYAGSPCDVRNLADIAECHKLLLIEDAAESIGAYYNKEPLGSFGIASMYSFTPTKVISTGEGGAAVTDSEEIYRSLKLFRSHGRLETEDYFSSIKKMDYISLGYGFRMPTICAAQGLAQLEVLKKIIEKRREIAKYYTQELLKIPEIQTPLEQEGYCHTYQMFTIRVKKGRKERNKLQKFLKKNGITAKIYFEPVHKTHYYDNILKYSEQLPVTEKISDQVLSIPIYPSLTKLEQNYIISKIKSFFIKYS